MSTYHLLTEVANQEDQIDTWQQYLDGTGEWQVYTQLYDRVTTRSVLEFLAISPDNPNSLVEFDFSCPN